jgi:hypothetical protein
MMKKIFNVTDVTKATDELLKATENPRHRKILKNFRRHAMLEVAGRWPEILVPEMTVPHPVYRIYEAGKLMILDGMNDVRNFYRTMAESGANVFGPIEEVVMVSDWGLAIESYFGGHVKGSALIAMGEDVDDPDAYYNVTRWIASFWPYNEDCILIGEHIYENFGSREITKLDPEDVITPEMARKILDPLLDMPPEQQPEWLRY